MITPAVLISAAGTPVLSTSNRLSRVTDRIRALAAELILHTAMTTLYAAIRILVTTSIAVGIAENERH